MRRGGQGNHDGQKRGMRLNTERDQNVGGGFIDADGDGQCDHLNQ